MKKIIVIAGLSVVLLASAGVLVFRDISAEGSAGEEVSEKAAKSLQEKIDTVKKAKDMPDRAPGASRLELSEVELESYVLFSLKDQIPGQLDSIDVQLEPGTVASETQLTFPSDATGNPMIDVVVSGTHNLYLKGNLVGQGSRGKFELQEVRVDGIPVPMILIQALFDKYVKPKYPDADLKEPFDLPWGIEELTLEQGKATVVY